MEIMSTRYLWNPQIPYTFKKFAFIHSLMSLCVHVCHGKYVGVRGQLLEVRSLLPSWVPGIRIIRLGGRHPLPVESYCWYLACF